MGPCPLPRALDHFDNGIVLMAKVTLARRRLSDDEGGMVAATWMNVVKGSDYQ